MTGEMKVKVYLRIAKSPAGRVSVKAATRPHRPMAVYQLGMRPPREIAFALVLDIPDAVMERDEHVVATVAVPESAAQIIAHVEAADTAN